MRQLFRGNLFGKLDRYIIRKFLGHYFFSIALIISIAVVFDYNEHIDKFVANNAPWRAIIFDYYLNFIPYFVNQFSALFTFIAVIFFTAKMAMQTEIVAILSGGVSFRRLMWPYMVGASIIAFSSIALNLWVIPVAQRVSIDFQSKYLKKNQVIMYDRHAYRQIDSDTYVYVRGFSPTSERIPFFALEKFEGSEMVETLNAASASYDAETGRWTAPRYVIYSRTEDGSLGYKQYRNLDTLINLDARELSDIKSLSQTLTIDELNDFLESQRRKGSDDVFIIEVERHIRYSYPFSTFILTIIAVALSSRKVRGGMGMQLGTGIALCFSYIMLGRVFEQIAVSGSLEPWICVWLPNMIFSVIAIFVYLKAPK